MTNLLKGEKTFGRGNLLRMWERGTWKGSILFWSGGEKKRTNHFRQKSESEKGTNEREDQ